VLRPFCISFVTVACSIARYSSILTGSSSITILREKSRTFVKSNTQISYLRATTDTTAIQPGGIQQSVENSYATSRILFAPG
jgi:hypothetical protein